MTAAPTVVVSRRVKPGREAEFERWAARVLAAAARHPGHVGAELQPPSDEHPEDWIIVYRFASRSLLDAWLGSSARGALMVESEPLLASPPREQILVQHANPGSVTAVVSQRIADGRGADFAALHARIAGELAGFPGFISSELIEPIPGIQDDHVILLAFRSRAELDAWLQSEGRRRWVAEMTPLLVGERTMNVVGGFAGWFPLSDGRAVKRWKQAVAVLSALFPVSLAVAFARSRLAPELPLVWTVLVSNSVGVAALTWLLMPAITVRLSNWLRS